MIHSNLRDKILEEAIGILYRDGVERITMRALAGALDYSPATLYLHFRSKQELIREIALRGFERLEEAMEGSASVEDPLEAAVDCMRRYIDFGFANPQLYRLMFHEFDVESYSEREQAHRELTWVFARTLHIRAIEAGVFRAGDPDAQTSATWATLHGFLLLALTGRLPSPSAELPVRLSELRDAVIESRLVGLRNSAREVVEAPVAPASNPIHR
jgi:AcrR family transcriptional regulator